MYLPENLVNMVDGFTMLGGKQQNTLKYTHKHKHYTHINVQYTCIWCTHKYTHTYTHTLGRVNIYMVTDMHLYEVVVQLSKYYIYT